MFSFHQFSSPKPCLHLSSAHKRYMPHPHSTYNHPNDIWLEVEIIEHIILYLFLSPTLSSVLGPNNFLSAIMSNTISLLHSFNVRDHLSHPCRTTGNIIIQFFSCHNIIFTCYTVRHEIKLLLCCSMPLLLLMQAFSL